MSLEHSHFKYSRSPPEYQSNSSSVLLEVRFGSFFALILQAASPIRIWNKLPDVLEPQHCALSNRYFPVNSE